MNESSGPDIVPGARGYRFPNKVNVSLEASLVGSVLGRGIWLLAGNSCDRIS